MKRLLTITSLLLLTSVNASVFETVGINVVERIIKDEVHKTTITLDDSTVRCSSLGYGMSELKISVPSLEWYAIFDHSNQDGRGPCVTAGTEFCNGFDRFSNENNIPDNLLDPDNTRQDIEVRVFLKEVFQATADSCLRTLKEHVETNVRGIPFTHVRVKSIGTLPLSECLQE